MKISIITVCKNAENCIEKTFQSVINQSSKDWEIIVLDGVSTDGTLDVIEKYKEYIAFFKSEKDEGIYDAMNKAQKFAKGDYILFLNAGDCLYDNFVIENTIKKIQELNYPDIVFGLTQFIDNNNKRIEQYRGYKHKYYFALNCMCHQSLFYKKELFEKAQYDTTLKVFADWEFTTKCIVENKAKIESLGFPTSTYCFDGFSSRPENKKNIKLETVKIQKRYFGKIYPILAIDRFLTKNLNSIYQGIRKFIFLTIFK